MTVPEVSALTSGLATVFAPLSRLSLRCDQLTAKVSARSLFPTSTPNRSLLSPSGTGPLLVPDATSFWCPLAEAPLEAHGEMVKVLKRPVPVMPANGVSERRNA